MSSTLDVSTVESDVVEVRVPVAVDALPVLRSVVATMTIGADFDVDRIEDTRLLADELCSTLIRNAEAVGPLVCRFHIDSWGLHIRASAPVAGPTELDRNGFGWRVISTLTDSVQSWSGQDADGRWSLHIETATNRSRGR